MTFERDLYQTGDEVTATLSIDNGQVDQDVTLVRLLLVRSITCKTVDKEITESKVKLVGRSYARPVPRLARGEKELSL